MAKLRLREVKLLAQDHRAGKCYSVIRIHVCDPTIHTLKYDSWYLATLSYFIGAEVSLFSFPLDPFGYMSCSCTSFS